MKPATLGTLSIACRFCELIVLLAMAFLPRWAIVRAKLVRVGVTQVHNVAMVVTVPRVLSVAIPAPLCDATLHDVTIQGVGLGFARKALFMAVTSEHAERLPRA